MRAPGLRQSNLMPRSLAANWEAASDLVRELAMSRDALFAVHRLTLNRLIGLLAADDLADRGLVPLSGLAAEAVAARAIYRLLSTPEGAARIEFFKPVASRPGFPGAIAQSMGRRTSSFRCRTSSRFQRTRAACCACSRTSRRFSLRPLRQAFRWRSDRMRERSSADSPSQAFFPPTLPAFLTSMGQICR